MYLYIYISFNIIMNFFQDPHHVIGILTIYDNKVFINVFFFVCVFITLILKILKTKKIMVIAKIKIKTDTFDRIK